MSLPAVLDPASGSRMFYFDREDERVLFGDIRDESHILVDGRALEIHPDVQMDFRDLPFPDESFRVVIFDPPHLNNVGPQGWIGKKCGILDRQTWRDDLRAGFSECFRVLGKSGVLIFKWNETQIPLREVLALTPHRPLVGHRSGKTMRTHWVTFLKPTSNDALPLDPKPWYERPTGNRFSISGWGFEFAPREGYEQDRAKYELSSRIGADS